VPGAAGKENNLCYARNGKRSDNFSTSMPSPVRLSLYLARQVNSATLSATKSDTDFRYDTRYTIATAANVGYVCVVAWSTCRYVPRVTHIDTCASVSVSGRLCVHDAPACVCGCTTDPAMTQEPIFVRAVGISFRGPPDPLESNLLVFIVQTTVDLDETRSSIYKRLTWKLEQPTWLRYISVAKRKNRRSSRCLHIRGTIDSPKTNALRNLYNDSKTIFPIECFERRLSFPFPSRNWNWNWNSNCRVNTRKSRVQRPTGANG